MHPFQHCSSPAQNICPSFCTLFVADLLPAHLSAVTERPMPPRYLLIRLTLPKGGNTAAVAQQIGQQDAHSLCKAGTLWLLDTGELPSCSNQAGMPHQGRELHFAGATMHSAAMLYAGVFNGRPPLKADEGQQRSKQQLQDTAFSSAPATDYGAGLASPQRAVQACLKPSLQCWAAIWPLTWNLVGHRLQHLPGGQAGK